MPLIFELVIVQNIINPHGCIYSYLYMNFSVVCMMSRLSLCPVEAIGGGETLFTKSERNETMKRQI